MNAIVSFLETGGASSDEINRVKGQITLTTRVAEGEMNESDQYAKVTINEGEQGLNNAIKDVVD